MASLGEDLPVPSTKGSGVLYQEPQVGQMLGTKHAPSALIPLKKFKSFRNQGRGQNIIPVISQNLYSGR